tara:strand:+ start:60452 stop:60847 length:396 start_codon:yes stop_codon:yes gene_type:complete
MLLPPLLLYYKSVSEKRELIIEFLEHETYNVNYLTDELLEKIILLVHEPIYTLPLEPETNYRSDISSVSTFSCNSTVLDYLELKENEYYIFYSLNHLCIRGNIMEDKYFEEFFPDVFVIKNRIDIIDQLIN